MKPSAPQPQPGQYARAFVLDRAKMQVDADKRTIEVSFSSEEPVERNWGIEVLDHSGKSCDLSRLQSAGPVLMDHNSRDQVGVVEKVWITDKVGRALLRFSKSARGQEVWQDIVDGIRRNVSVSYRIDDLALDSEKDGVPTYRIRSWTPSEISIVSVPADTSVGVGRGDESPVPPQPQPPAPIMNRQQITAALSRAGIPYDSNATDDQLRELLLANLNGQRNQPKVEVLDEAAVSTRAAKSERERMTGIQALYHQHRCADVDKEGKLLGEFLSDGNRSVQDMQRWILENRYKAQPIVLDPSIGMNEKEVRSYSIVRALHQLASGRPLEGIEAEASAACAKRLKRSPEGFFIPHDVSSRSLGQANALTKDDMFRMVAGMAAQRALSAGSAAAGGYTVGTDILTGSLIELLRNRMTMVDLGARVISDLMGDVAIPRHTGGATAYWLDETATLTASDQTFGQLALTPHRLGGATAYTKQLLAQSSLDVEAFVRQDLMTVLAIEKDRACINGLNAAGEPLGILNTTGIGGVTFGATATRAKAIEFQTDVASANAHMGSLAYLTTPATSGKWMSIDESTSTAQWLWKGNVDEGIVVGRRAVATNQVPSNKVIYGNFNDLIIADWAGMDVVVDPYSLSLTGQVRIVVHILTDCGIRHVGSFSVSSDSGAQ